LTAAVTATTAPYTARPHRTQTERSDYVSFGTGPAITGEMSLFTWLKAGTTSGISGLMGIADGGTTAKEFLVEIHRSSQRLTLLWGGALLLTSSTNLGTDWHHVGFVRSGSAGNWTGTFYLDGNADGTTTTATDPTTAGNPFIVGRYGSYAGYYYTGLIDDTHIWDRPLSIQDIRRVMLGLHPLS
jgi:hypothetical protein